VTEIDAPTGALVRVISGARTGFDQPVALAPMPPDLFVAGYEPVHHRGSVTEIDASTGAVVRVISGP
jgi:hypothetical protein